MHLVDVLNLRPIPAAAVLLGLTRRCPLTCRHCSTNSLMDSEEHPDTLFLGLVDSFTEASRPEVILMSGGEALLRPKLVRDLAIRSKAVGTKSHLLSGMYFAKHGDVPDRIFEAIEPVDHFAASLDVFHEEQIPRRQVLKALRQIAENGTDVSLQITGLNADDPYLDEVVADVHHQVGDDTPILVSTVSATGRATDWLESAVLAPASAVGDPEPCGLAAWPLVCFDGTVIACCNQSLVDRPGSVPEHLRLGHVSTDGWPAIAERARQSALLRAIRLIGPCAVAARSGAPAVNGYCETCYTLSDNGSSRSWAESFTASPTFPLLEETVSRMEVDGGARRFSGRYGASRFAGLVQSGYKSAEVSCAE